jgi:hypothetical protein
MDASEVYLIYCSIKAHFSRKNYDYHKFGGKTKAKRASFYKRKDRLFFVRIARKFSTKKEIENYIVANYVKYKGGYIGDFNEDVYNDWKKRTESLTYNFLNEVTPYVDKFEELFEWKDNHPLLLKEYLGKRVSIETMVILEELINYIKDWDNKDLIWKDNKIIIQKYKNFLTIDRKRCKVELMKVIK